MGINVEKANNITLLQNVVTHLIPKESAEEKSLAKMAGIAICTS
jgi:hypothetical protein